MRQFSFCQNCISEKKNQKKSRYKEPILSLPSEPSFLRSTRAYVVSQKIENEFQWLSLKCAQFVACKLRWRKPRDKFSAYKQNPILKAYLYPVMSSWQQHNSSTKLSMEIRKSVLLTYILQFWRTQESTLWGNSRINALGKMVTEVHLSKSALSPLNL